MSENRYVTEESLIRFQGFLQQEERSAGTIEKYMRDVKNFAAWIEDQSSVPSGFSCCEVTKDTAVRWKQYLLQSGRAPSTVNSISSLCAGRIFVSRRSGCKSLFFAAVTVS